MPVSKVHMAELAAVLRQHLSNEKARVLLQRLLATQAAHRNASLRTTLLRLFEAIARENWERSL